MLTQPLVAALAAFTLFLDGAAGHKSKIGNTARRNQNRAAKIVHDAQAAHQLHARGEDTTNSTTPKRFLTSKTEPYLVKSLPEVNYDIGEMYAGLVPIDTSNTSRGLFSIFQPTIGAPVDEVTIWLNGGPGCSSLEAWTSIEPQGGVLFNVYYTHEVSTADYPLGFFQENGRFTWQPGTFAPTKNPYSWVNLTNVLWVEQPVGTGFSIGEVTATSQEDIAQDFIKFFKNWQDIFGIKNFKIFVTGESYAGRYVPYISAAMIDQNNTEYYDLQGALAYDPCIGDFVYTQEEAVAVPYVQAYNNVLGLNESFVETLVGLDQSCGYAALREKYLTFPPPGNQPPAYFNYTSQANCDVFDMIDNAALGVNPCFDIYEVTQSCPLMWDVLGFPTQFVFTPEGADVYFNRSDVKAALHAPQYVDWAECSVDPVFLGSGGPQGEGDLSADPIQKVLPQVIEKTNRVLVGNGDFDMIIITNGTLLAIQNMTWNGQLGFQTMPSTPINITIPDLQYEGTFDNQSAMGIDGPQGIVGVQHYERGLMWVETYQSGHMQPEFQPRAAYRHLEWVLGRVDTV